ncbi:hypothetical protein [Methylocystis sp. ATCC 49242]|uniref:hypothetical protein n=1 Tax=Methylocystis sp. ATCC 49242 TaxID=622637 RepID=UPI0001F8882C|nr:hypothetical protein [Methylocystis sp. ATCC 49242]
MSLTKEMIQRSRDRIEAGLQKDAERRRALQKARDAAIHARKVEALKAELTANPSRHASARRHDAELIETPADGFDLNRAKNVLRQRRYRQRKKAEALPAPKLPVGPNQGEALLVEIERRLSAWVARNSTGARERAIKNRLADVVASYAELLNAREHLGREPTLSEYAEALGQGATRMVARRRLELLHRLEAVGGPLAPVVHADLTQADIERIEAALAETPGFEN